jgi:hypothetical protein
LYDAEHVKRGRDHFAQRIRLNTGYDCTHGDLGRHGGRATQHFAGGYISALHLMPPSSRASKAAPAVGRAERRSRQAQASRPAQACCVPTTRLMGS